MGFGVVVILVLGLFVLPGCEGFLKTYGVHLLGQFNYTDPAFGKKKILPYYRSKRINGRDDFN